jgi:hypothetical protein
VTQRIGNPFPIFLDRAGRPLTGGKVYIGEAGEDPEISPVDAFYDPDLESAATQPINTIGGIMTRDGNPTPVFVDEDQYSIRVRDADGAEVFYMANAVLGAGDFQPLNTNLTAIAALSTTSFGRGLLEAANAAGLREYGGIVDPLPLAGGTMTGEIKRSGAGAYPYMASSGYTVARIFVTENGADDPREQAGDIWLEEEA